MIKNIRYHIPLFFAVFFVAWGCITYAPISVDVEGDVDVNVEIDGGLVNLETVPDSYKDRVKSVFNKLLGEENDADAGI